MFIKYVNSISKTAISINEPATYSRVIKNMLIPGGGREMCPAAETGALSDPPVDMAP